MKQSTSEQKNILAIFSDQSKLRSLGFALSLLIVSVVVALVVGAYDISLDEVVRTLFIPSGKLAEDKLPAMIIWQIRLPRILLAIAVGAALSTAGAVFQACFRNPLVEPYILGVSAGSAFGAALGIVFPQFFLSIQLLAFVFGAAAVFSAVIATGNCRNLSKT